MNNREEYAKIKNILGDEIFPDEDFARRYARKFFIWRNIFYIAVLFTCFYVFQNGRFFPKDIRFQQILILIMLFTTGLYLKYRMLIHAELSRYMFREPWPDRAIARYLSFMPMMLKRQALWNAIQYNMGCALYRLGKISKANECLYLMQSSCTTAGNMLLAEHLKMLIAMYYEDYNTVISCANEAAMLYSKARHTTWNKKIYGDIEQAGAYAGCVLRGDYQQILTLLQTPKIRPLDEMVRYYYLYLTAMRLNDYENAERYRTYVKNNAGSTWYGKAIGDDFIQEGKPVNYPGFSVNAQLLNNPDKIDKNRIKYALIGVGIVILFWVIPRIF